MPIVSKKIVTSYPKMPKYSYLNLNRMLSKIQKSQDVMERVITTNLRRPRVHYFRYKHSKPPTKKAKINLLSHFGTQAAHYAL